MRICSVPAIFLIKAALILMMPCNGWAKVGGGDIVFRPDGAAAVTYSHEFHAVKAGIGCKECHYRIYTTVEGRRKSNMAEMIKGQSCGACHNGNRAFTVRKNCDRCHR